MKRIAGACAAVVIAVVALAQPYKAPEGNSPALAPVTSCETVLDNNTYSCNIKSSFSTSFTDTFTFASPGTVSSHFDLTVAGLGSTLGCSCNPTGSLKNPKFNASKNAFSCDGAPGGEAFDFTGKVSGSGKIKGHISGSTGDSFIYECTKGTTTTTTTASTTTTT